MGINITLIHFTSYTRSGPTSLRERKKRIIDYLKRQVLNNRRYIRFGILRNEKLVKDRGIYCRHEIILIIVYEFITYKSVNNQFCNVRISTLLPFSQ